MTERNRQELSWTTRGKRIFNAFAYLRWTIYDLRFGEFARIARDMRSEYGGDGEIMGRCGEGSSNRPCLVSLGTDDYLPSAS